VAALQRGSSDVVRASRPGEIAFTPLVARISSQLQSSPHVQNSPLKKYGKNRGPLQVNIDWTQVPGDLRKLVQGTSEAYANVLQATTDGYEKSWKGTRSLMGACLRRLPAYIELEEHFAKLDREEDDEDEERDVSGEIYEHLQDHFEQRPGQGWRPFKQVLRAHATTLFCDAVTDEIIGLDSVSMLVTHCVRVFAWDEAERLLLAYLPLLEPISIPNNIKADLFDAQRSPYLHAVKSFVDHTGRHRLLFDLFEHMIANELLPLEWLATEAMRPLWDRLVRSTSNNDQRTIAPAMRFFETVTMAGMGLPDERLLADDMIGARRFVPSLREELRLALNTTFSSLLTVLCSIALVNNGRDDENGRGIAGRVTWMLDAVVISILSRTDIRSEFKLLAAHAEDGQLFLQRAIWPVFASFLVHLDNRPAEKESVTLQLPELIRGVNWLATQYSSDGTNTASILGDLPAFISSIARGTGRIWKDDGFEQLQRLVQTLMSLSGYRLPHKLWTLKRMALESAMEFAQNTGVGEHSTYAREIEMKMRTQGQLIIVPSPHKNESPSANGGFRWEEGIGEWVACTPFVKQSMKRIARKPIPALELLPTPSQSEDEDVVPKDNFDDSSIWDTTAFDQDEDDVVPQSSPIKKPSRIAIMPLGKRHRACSPMVIVPVKRTRMTPPESPIEYYPQLPEEKNIEEGSRRSRRSRKDIEELKSRLQRRSRTSMESGLRLQQRKTYAEQFEANEEMSDETSSSESDVPESSATPSDMDTDTRHSEGTTRRPRGRPREQLPQLDGCYDTDERDDLGITPARPVAKRQTSSRNTAQGAKQWWKIGGHIVPNSDDDGSEDELSFH
jgi:hypothetical protein